jgi:hypothetical protein
MMTVRLFFAVSAAGGVWLHGYVGAGLAMCVPVVCSRFLILAVSLVRLVAIVTRMRARMVHNIGDGAAV